MSRSLRVGPNHISQVKLALKRNGFPSQQALATEMGIARATISNFLNGKPVDFVTVVELCERLGLDWQAIADIEDRDTPRETEQVSYPLASRSEPEAVITSTRSDGTIIQTEEEFIEAARNWDLEKLYADLEAAKREWGVNKRWGLTKVEKQYLQGLLCGYSPDEIAAKLDKDVRLVRVQLSNNLYRYVEKLLDRPPNSLENWRDIVIWLAEAGYRLDALLEQTVQNASVDIDALVQKVREKVKPLIQEQCGTMRVLDMTVAIGLDDIYTKVNILEKITGRRRIGIDELLQGFEAESETFDRFGLGKVSEARVDALKAVNEHPKLMVWGKPGAGKTTFLKYLAIQCIGGKLQANRVPIFIEIDQFAQIYQPELQTFINQILANCEVTDTQAFELLKQGRFFILLDGLDEVRQEDSYRILKQIQYFLNNFHMNQFVMTCRIAGQQYSPVNFMEVEIADFDKQQIIQFANKWFQKRYYYRKAENFIKKLNRDKSIAELATNPLLLTMLCLVFEETQELPSNRFDLYKEAVDILLEKWDASRAKERRKIYEKLSASRRRDLLSYIAYKTFDNEQYFFTLDNLKEYIADYIGTLPNTLIEREALLRDSEEVVESIESQHGLLVERAKGIYSFSHLTFHEYFTARQITFAHSPQEFDENLRNLLNHLTDNRWREVFLRVTERLQKADYILQLMKERIDKLVAEDNKLQDFLEDVYRKSLSFDLEYKQAAIRAFHLDIDLEIDVDHRLGCLIDFICTCVFTCASILARVLNSDITPPLLNKGFELASDLANDPDIDLDVAIALERVDAINILEREFVSELEPEMRQKLQQLKEQLPDRNADKEKFKQWWEFNGQNWTEQVRARIVSNYEIGDKHWQKFSEEQKQLLKQYYDANLLLLECMKSARISAKVRSEIEETLLLPIAEIERRKK